MGAVEVIGSNKLRYNYTCEKRHGRYDCGGGVDRQFFNNVEIYDGYVEADITVNNEKVAVNNV